MMRRNVVEQGSAALKLRPQSEPLLFDNLIDREELARRLSVSPSFISKLMALEGLPHFKIGRAVRFELESVKSWLQKRKMP